MKVTDYLAVAGDRLVLICDFSPPRAVRREPIDAARDLPADFICVAYNPGKRVRVDSAMLSAAIERETGRRTIFNLATRDMNKVALQTHLLGAQMLGLDNVIVVGGDNFSEKELAQVGSVRDFKPTELLAAAAAMNDGRDYRGGKLNPPTDLGLGATIDLGRDLAAEAALTARKVAAGAHFFITQPIFDVNEVDVFREAYYGAAGALLDQPVFYGVQLLHPDGIIFSHVPAAVRNALQTPADGIRLAHHLIRKLLDQGINTIYLVPPIMKGGARDYAVARDLIEAVRGPERGP